MKCLCNHCSTPLEFDNHLANTEAECPGCLQKTTLYEMKKEPKSTASGIKKASSIASRTASRGAELLKYSLAALGLVVFAFFGYAIASGIGLLLAILIIATYSGLEEVRKEVANLRH